MRLSLHWFLVALVLSFTASSGGVSASAAQSKLEPWFSHTGTGKLLPQPKGRNQIEAFIEQAKRDPKQVIVGDAVAGLKTNGDFVTAIFALKPQLEKLQGQTIGVMLPGSVISTILKYGLPVSGKTLAEINFTVGQASIESQVRTSGAEVILTSKKLVEKLGDSVAGVQDKFVFVEDLLKGITPWQKLVAGVKGKFPLFWGELKNAPISPEDTAVLLFTSGSSGEPKGVPLKQKHQFSNVQALAQFSNFKEGDSFLDLLPGFHSFGNTVKSMMLTLGVRTFYHPNPTEPAKIADLVARYKITHLAGTPTFLRAIFTKAKPGQLDSLRVVISGAEKLKRDVYDLILSKSPQVEVLNGYGMTEAGPGIAAQRSGDENTFGSVGPLLPGVDGMVVNPDALDFAAAPALPAGSVGRLLVSGPSIFDGYMNQVPASFVERDGKRWLDTGDLGRFDERGHLFIEGRMSRFSKIGGEMVPHEKIEEEIAARLPPSSDGSPVVAVTDPSEDDPTITLLTTVDVTREELERFRTTAGLPPIFKVRKIVRVSKIPVLGAGKLDLREMKRLAKEG